MVSALVTGVALFAFLSGGRFSSVDVVSAEPSATQLLVASLLAPSLLSPELHILDKDGADVSATVAELLVASQLADSLRESTCGSSTHSQGGESVDAALVEIKSSLPASAYEKAAVALTEWRVKGSASTYGQILADLPAELAGSAHCQVLRDIAADRLDRAVRRWDELKPRLPGTTL